MNSQRQSRPRLFQSPGNSSWVQALACAGLLLIAACDEKDRTVTDEETVALQRPVAITIDYAAGRALIADVAARAIYQMDLESARVSLFSGPIDPDDVQPLTGPRAIELDRDRNRAVVFDALWGSDGIEGGHIFSIDLDTGTRNRVAYAGSPAARTMAFDHLRNRSLMINLGHAMLPWLQPVIEAVDLTTDDLQIFSGPTTPNADVPFTTPLALVIDEAGNRALVTEVGRVLSVDLDTGARSVLSGAMMPDPVPLLSPQAIALDTTNGRALIVDAGRVIAVDLATGERSLLSAGVTGQDPDAIAVDTANGRALLVDSDLRAIVAVDLTSGARSIVFSSSASP